MPDNQEEKISQRFKEIRKNLGKSQKEFAKEANILQSQVSEIENGKRNITAAIYIALEDTFNIDRKWLETGEGQMIKKKPNPRLEAKPISLFPTEENIDPENPHSRFLYAADGTIGMKVSVVPHKAQAGYRLGFRDPEFFEDFDYVIIPVDHQHKSEYLGFEVVGDSMTNLSSMEMAKRSIFPGRIAVGRSLDRSKWAYKLHTHNYSYWVIVHKTEGILIKEISKHDVEKGIITIHSLNPEWEDEDLHLDDIEQIFSVVQIVDKSR